MIEPIRLIGFRFCTGKHWLVVDTDVCPAGRAILHLQNATLRDKGKKHDVPDPARQAGKHPVWPKTQISHRSAATPPS
jgi:hypothetical protein